MQVFKRISYRARMGEHRWKRVHLYVYHSEYELFLDVKKLWRIASIAANFTGDHHLKCFSTQRNTNHRAFPATLSYRPRKNLLYNYIQFFTVAMK